MPVEKVYSFNPTPDVLTDEEKGHIIGVQATCGRSISLHTAG